MDNLDNNGHVYPAAFSGEAIIRMLRNGIVHDAVSRHKPALFNHFGLHLGSEYP